MCIPFVVTASFPRPLNSQSRVYYCILDIRARGAELEGRIYLIFNYDLGKLFPRTVKSIMDLDGA